MKRDDTADRAIAERVRDAAASGTPLRIVGRGTWLDAGHPVAATETLSLAGDTGVVAYTPGDLTITVRAGTTLGDLNEVVRAADQWIALDPDGGADITIGATVATCSYGPSAPLFGT
ncbi:MAG TPA: FAD-binding protein, partial [Candidatus Elarobacter sp.]|nr:FAD-binding protein [Candidatus Elarobacter sp.]